jgi:RHS repeat-associated protein
LSGTLEGAGGIGGLLARSHGYSGGNWSTHNFYHADGNGNITYLVTSAQGLAASYRYDPFGNALSWSGSLADDNVYRFSSKEFHAQSGLYYYGYRFYAPSLQRWLNRDPLEELGGINLYAFVRNRPTTLFDKFELREGLFGTPTLSLPVDFWPANDPKPISTDLIGPPPPLVLNPPPPLPIHWPEFHLPEPLPQGPVITIELTFSPFGVKCTLTIPWRR